jgi:hypothetical protein
MGSPIEKRIPAWAWALIVPALVIPALGAWWSAAARDFTEAGIIPEPPKTVSPAHEVRLAAAKPPAAFDCQGTRWMPTGETTTPRDTALRDIGLTVERSIVYARLDAEPPYTALYVETHPGSEVFVRYRPAPIRGRSG